MDDQFHELTIGLGAQFDELGGFLPRIHIPVSYTYIDERNGGFD
jgi:hypothetical protein